jgi:uncharacterized OsmC-like protein
MTIYATGAEFLTTAEIPTIAVSDVPRPLTPTVRSRSAGASRSSVDIRHRTLSLELPRQLGGEGDAPSPFEYVLGGFAACLTSVVQLVAREQGVLVADVDVLTTGTVDPQGLRGQRGVPAGFQSITGRVELSGNVDAAQLVALVAEVERRCPIHTLLAAAGIPPQLRWVVTPA